jgi:tRNA pseudouridine13 synthase
MKLKQRPEDFFVEELTEVAPSDKGPYALYRMRKEGWGTPEAMQAVRQRWRIAPRRIAFGGLKDRHAKTVQYLTILHGPQKGLVHGALSLEYLGRLDRPFTSHDIRANRFSITLSALESDVAARAEQALADIREQGIPNYFDDQRFGSVGSARQFVGRLLVFEKYEDALRMAIAAEYRHDRSLEKQQKRIVRQHWNDWAACLKKLRPGSIRRIVDFLVARPTDFQGALQHLQPELRQLLVSAYQSYLWNRMLTEWLKQVCLPWQLIDIPLKLGSVPMHLRLDPERLVKLAALRLPLPSARLARRVSQCKSPIQESCRDDSEHVTQSNPVETVEPLLQKVLLEEGLRLEQLQLRGLKGMTFPPGLRPALCMPAHLSCETALDPRHDGKKKMTLQFELQRGSYATLLIKRITLT